MEWTEALWYRDDDEDDIAARFVSEGITPEQLQQWLNDLATGNLGWHILREQISDRTAALVAIELDALGDAIRQDAADLRGSAIRAMNQKQSVADIARSLGLTRQAASRSANSEAGESRIMRALSDIGRTVMKEMQ